MEYGLGRVLFALFSGRFVQIDSTSQYGIRSRDNNALGQHSPIATRRDIALPLTCGPLKPKTLVIKY